MSAKIYLIRNTINKKIYIGSTRTDLQDRWSTHISMLVTGKHNKDFVKDWKTIDIKNWQFEILEDDIPVEQQFLIEKLYIDKYKPFSPVGYNKSKNPGTHLFVPKNIFCRKDILDKIITDLKNRIAYRKISTQYGISLGTITTVAKRMHLQQEKINIFDHPELVEKIKEMLLSGNYSRTEISSILSVKVNDVYKVYNKFDFGYRIDRFKDRVIKLREKGLSYRDIQKVLRTISTGSIGTIIKENEKIKNFI